MTWPPRLRLPASAAAALSTAPRRWSLEELAGSRCQQRALGQLYTEAPSLRTVLQAAADAVRSAGAVIVEAVPTADTALVIAASALGVPSAQDNGSPGRLVWDVRPGAVAGPGAAAGPIRSQRPEAFPLHTDSAHLTQPHAVVGLACVQPSADGSGLSLLVAADQVRDTLCAQGLAEQARLLGQPCFPFASVSADGRPVHRRPILPLVDRCVEVRYREPLLRWGLQLSPRLAPANEGALEALGAVLARPSLPTRILLQAHDFLLFDNQRMLHGRTAMEPGSTRHLKRLKLHCSSR